MNNPDDFDPKEFKPVLSYWPMITAFAILLIAAGVIFSFYISIFGLVLLLIGIFGWSFENRGDDTDAP